MLDTVPTRPRWTLAATEANKLTKDYSKPPIPVRFIAEKSGIDVVFADFGKHSDAVAGFCDFARARLFVNRSDKPVRQSFTIAHELGHWILHRELFTASPARYPVLPRYTMPNHDDPLEKEANHFAANLLVPVHLLEPVKNASVSSLAQAFGVSVTMMGFRVRNA